ncbi:MAG: VanZ family protein, partial [Alphaproteobacteria bacterium]|nr:VanZ family protein [Alphaproteobacteria bacterium]
MNASAPPFGSPVSRPLRWGWLAWAYAVAIVYVSTILGPAGLNFVPRDPLAAFGDFLSMPYNVHGSDQRQDWMANMLMFAVLGFLLSAALTGTGRTRPGRLLGAFTIAVGFLLTVKYAQLYFPPRTVSINYVLAQTLGAAIGVSVFALLRRRVDEALAAIAAGGRRLLIAALALYSAAFLLFIVFPFDFTLSADDLAERLAVLPSVLMGWPGDDRSLLFRIVLSLASIATAAPLGMLLRLANPRRGGMALLVTAMIAIGAAMAAAMFVISAQPKLATLVLRAIGVAIGLAIARRLERGGIDRLLPYLRASVPVVAIAYLAMLGLTKNVFTTDYDSLAGAIDRFAPNGLLPLWHHYIVSKSQAARSVLVQIVLFAPIGVMTWLIAGRGRGAAWFAGLSALLLAEAIEVARWLQPALQPDFTNGFIAAAAAVAMFRLSPILWSMVAELRPASPSVDRHPGVATMITPGIRSRESTRVPDIEPASDIELPLDPVPS